MVATEVNGGLCRDKLDQQTEYCTCTASLRWRFVDCRERACELRLIRVHFLSQENCFIMLEKIMLRRMYA
jgi:hypothetical protein